MNAEVLARKFEGSKALAYRDTGGIWTIGIGHTGPDVHEGLIWTQVQIETEFVHDLHCAEVQLLSYSPSVAALSGALAALTDFVFNLGIARYRTSTLCRDVNAGNWPGARAQIVLWNHGRVNGQLTVLANLTERRAAECALLPN